MATKTKDEIEADARAAEAKAKADADAKAKAEEEAAALAEAEKAKAEQAERLVVGGTVRYRFLVGGPSVQIVPAKIRKITAGAKKGDPPVLDLEATIFGHVRELGAVTRSRSADDAGVWLPGSGS
jgi:hypothetical protein